MTGRQSILCAALLLLLAEYARSDAGAMKSSNDFGVLMSQGVARCPAFGPSLEPTDSPATSALPQVEQFLAREHFKETASSLAKIKISWLGATFRHRFLQKVEDGRGAVLRTFVLRKSSRDAEIIAELNIRHETKLSDLWCLLTLQPNGETGTLLTDGVPNIFYIRDSDGVLGAVDAVWGGAGWEIGANSVEGPSQWLTGRQVISR